MAVACTHPQLCGVQSHIAGSTAARDCARRASPLAPAFVAPEPTRRAPLARDGGPHALVAIERTSDRGATYRCRCGADGTGSIGWAGDNLEARTKLNHGHHAARAFGVFGTPVEPAVPVTVALGDVDPEPHPDALIAAPDHYLVDIIHSGVRAAWECSCGADGSASAGGGLDAETRAAQWQLRHALSAIGWLTSKWTT